MVRNYVPKTKEKSYSDDDLCEGVRLVKEEGKAVREAAKLCKVPVETLRRWVVKPPKTIGSGSGSQVLSPFEEELIVVGLETSGRLGWACGTKDVKYMVKTYLDNAQRKTRFTDNLPGKDWMIAFKKRWSHRLSVRKPEILTKARKNSLTQETLDQFFDLVQSAFTESGVNLGEDHASRIYNCDETGLSTDPISKKIFISKNSRDAYLETPCAGKSMYTVLFCISAAGRYLPPFVVYKSLNLYHSWTIGGPPGTLYGCTPSGWMQDIVFENWFLNSFVRHVAHNQKPVFLFYDGHGSHLTYRTVKTAMEESIMIICLPPHSSHALQPLDVAVFKPLKEQWKDILQQYYRQSRMQTVDKATFPSLLSQLWRKISHQNARSGFRGTGLWPLNKAAVPAGRIMKSFSSSANDDQSAPDSHALYSPRKLLQDAILTTISPPLSAENKAALKNKSLKRRRIQANAGELLTTEDVCKRLQQEEHHRKEKLAKKCPVVCRKLASVQAGTVDDRDSEPTESE